MLKEPMSEKPDQFRNRSRGEYVYRVLRDAIQDGRYLPGERVREDDIAKALGVSRTPVREALHRLSECGLLELAAGRGLVVVELNKQQMIELYAMREVLEGAAAGLAAQHASAAEIDTMARLLEEFLSAGDEPEKLAHINRLFHQTVYDAAHNRYLLQTLNQLRDAMALLRHTTFALPGRSLAVDAEHQAIVQAIRERSPERAEQAARLHIREAQRARMELQFQDYAEAGAPAFHPGRIG
jgi:DNA-binding GntR family transcriptional regulator